jgi:hypothetical protein
MGGSSQTSRCRSSEATEDQLNIDQAVASVSAAPHTPEPWLSWRCWAGTFQGSFDCLKWEFADCQVS